MSKAFKRLSHTIYECKYHIVFCPKYRFRILEGEVAGFVLKNVYQLLGYKEKVEVLVGLDEEKIRLYVRWQEQKEKEIESKQLNLFN